MIATPGLHLRTLYVLDDAGRLVRTREPGTWRPPAFVLVRGPSEVAWAVRTDVSSDLAAELRAVASDEPPAGDLGSAPVHAQRYLAFVRGRVESGPAFAFPEEVTAPSDATPVEDPSVLHRHFADLVDEIAERSPAFVVLDAGHAVSVCHCARQSDEAAEAGLSTTESHRGRGIAGRVTAAWAGAIRAAGRTPLYSTSWTNEPSRAVARKLGLVAYASNWSIAD